MKSPPATPLTTTNHDRDAAGMRYIYPVASRRAGGLSIGVNLNPNNACNWCCCYCQVPNLERGHAPDIDLSQLQSELNTLLHQVQHSDFLQKRLPSDMQTLCDIAISGNGEPTSSKQFAAVVTLLTTAMSEAGVDVPLRLITNGSYAGHDHVQQGLRMMARHNGEAWVKVDRGDPTAIRRINGITLTTARLRWQVEQIASCCPTWVQSCMVSTSTERTIPAEEITAYLNLIQQLAPFIKGVHLYAPVRPSHQQPAHTLPQSWMEHLAAKIADIGLKVRLA